MQPHPITAVDLVVRDLERSVDFYTRYVGLPEAAVSADGRTAFAASPEGAMLADPDGFPLRVETAS